MHGTKRRKKSGSEKWQEASAVTRSGARRYKRHLLGSFRDSPDGPEPFAAQVAHAVREPLAAAWLGHATVLLRLGGLWILTDPVFSRRIGVRIGPVVFGVERQLPPVDPATLPPIDLVLISHAHFDHLDRPTLRGLLSPKTKVLTADKTAELIPRGFENITELGWNEHIELNGLRIRAIRPEHWGARTVWDRHRGYNSYILESKDERVLFAGDTAYCDAFDRVGGVDLSIFGIGAYDPWIAKHANPEQVWHMATAAGTQRLLPMHHSTFELSDEPATEPLERLNKIAGGNAKQIVGTGLGTLWAPGSDMV